MVERSKSKNIKNDLDSHNELNDNIALVNIFILHFNLSIFTRLTYKPINFE